MQCTLEKRSSSMQSRKLFEVQNGRYIVSSILWYGRVVDHSSIGSFEWGVFCAVIRCRVNVSQVPHLTCFWKFEEQVGWGTWLGKCVKGRNWECQYSTVQAFKKSNRGQIVCRPTITSASASCGKSTVSVLCIAADCRPSTIAGASLTTVVCRVADSRPSTGAGASRATVQWSSL